MSISECFFIPNLSQYQSQSPTLSIYLISSLFISSQELEISINNSFHMDMVKVMMIVMMMTTTTMMMMMTSLSPGGTPYRKGVFSNMGCSQIYIQCSTLIHQCRHHRHHHGHHQRDLGVRALNEGRICSRLCLTIQDTHPLATLPRLSLSSSSSPSSPSLYIPSGSSKIKEYSKYPKRDYNCIFYFRSLSFVRS